MIADIHTHIVYGVDDGATDLEMSRKMMLRAAEQGIGQIVCTSHATPGIEPFPAEKYIAHLHEMRELAEREAIPVKLYSGCEILYTGMTARMVSEHRIPTLAETYTVLVEFGGDVTFDKLKECARSLGSEGYSVIFAHIERYPVLRSIGKIRELRERDEVMMQMNANTVFSKKGFFEKRWVDKVLEEGLIDIVSSDAHNLTSRKCNMQQALEWLTDEYDEEYAQDLCGNNARRILNLR